MQGREAGSCGPSEKALNPDGTITVPYLTSVTGIVVLTPFMIDEVPIQNIPYAAGVFDYSAGGGFLVGNKIAFNASLPLWLV